jgi:hypothetical protein
VRSNSEELLKEHPDFSVVVKNRGRPPSPWKWEIYRSGRKSPVKQSDVYFSTVTEANRAGRKAFSLFLSEFQDEAPVESPPKILPRSAASLRRQS